MYIKLTSIFLLLAILLCFASCSKNNEDGQKLKYYTINNEDSLCVELIQKYNNYCLKNLDESYQIEIVEFDSEDTMLTKISTEIMAGKGPDIISLNQKLPFEKLIDNGSFADIDELAELYKSDIDFDDYNSTIMDCGIYNGKRYIIPIAYCPNILITTQEILDKYNLENTNFSFKELEIRLSDKDHSYALFGNKDETYKFFLSYVNEYVDFYNKTTEFSSDEFTESLDYIGKMIRNDNSRKEGTTWDITGNYLFRTSQLSFDGSMMSTLNSYLSTQPSENSVFSRLFACVILKPYVFSLVFALMSENKGNFLLFAADYLIQQPCGSTLRFPCSVSVDIHCGTDISVSEKLLHILWGSPI